MNFLYCTPSVFVIGEEYEILINLKESGLVSVEAGGEVFYEDCSGLLSSESLLIKIRVPQDILDRAKAYRVTFRRTIERKGYYSTFKDPLSADFAFKPLEKEDDINIYHVADVHYRFDVAKKTASFFGDDLDLLVVNGDIGEVETVENYLEVCRFVGEVSRGRIPVVFVRGNHDTRGHLAERFTDFFPSVGKKTFYSFRVGTLRGIALDCGEDKRDYHIEYGGMNIFERYRQEELAFLRSLSPENARLTFAVSHICPARTTHKEGDIFDIERDTYTQWNRELSRLGVSFMLSAHIHHTYILESNDERSLLPHDYSVIVGSACPPDDLWGAALTLSGDKLTVRFTDSEKQVRETHILDTKTGKLYK